MLIKTERQIVKVCRWSFNVFFPHVALFIKLVNELFVPQHERSCRVIRGVLLFLRVNERFFLPHQFFPYVKNLSKDSVYLERAELPGLSIPGSARPSLAVKGGLEYRDSEEPW